MGLFRKRENQRLYKGQLRIFTYIQVMSTRTSTRRVATLRRSVGGSAGEGIIISVTVGRCSVSQSSAQRLSPGFGIQRFTYGNDSIILLSSRLMILLRYVQRRFKGPMRVADKCHATTRGTTINNDGSDRRLLNQTTSFCIRNVSITAITTCTRALLPTQNNVKHCPGSTTRPGHDAN